MAENPYLMQFYDRNVYQDMIFRHYIVHYKRAMIKFDKKSRENLQVLLEFLKKIAFDCTQSDVLQIESLGLLTFIFYAAVQISTLRFWCKSFKMWTVF